MQLTEVLKWGEVSMEPGKPHSWHSESLWLISQTRGLKRVLLASPFLTVSFIFTCLEKLVQTH